MLTSGYWPWWLGAASLAVVTVGSCVVARRPLGVSGIVGRFVDLRAELAAERQRRAMEEHEAALQAMLLAMTAEAFGPPGAAPAVASQEPAGTSDGIPLPIAGAGGAPSTSAGCRSCGAASSRPSLAAHAAFLLAMVGGGLAVQLARGSWTPSFDLGATFGGLFGHGPLAVAVLGVGGFLVGVGTTLSGGCSTGHGLSGCSRLQVGSVVATGAFLAAAVGVSLLLSGSLS